MKIEDLVLDVSFAAATAASALLPRAQTCYSGVYIIAARGTFESQDYVGYGLQGSLVTSILNAIPNSNASAVVYPASVVNYGDSVGVGAANAQQQILAYHSACPTSSIVLLGYSQGAQVIGNALAGGGTGIPVFGGVSDPNAAITSDVASSIIAINLAGDPNRVKGQGTDFDPMTCSTSSTTPRTGSNFAAMQPYANKLSEFCHQGDPVCCTDGSDSTSHLGYFLSESNIDTMTRFVVKKYLATKL